MAYQMAAMAVTLNDLEGNSPVTLQAFSKHASIGADSIGAVRTFAPVLFKVLGREYSFALVLFPLHRLTQVCFS